MQLSRDDLLDAYRRMQTIRVFEERVESEFENGTIPGFVHVYCGEEASGVGVCMHLTDEDIIASTHRGHGHCIAKGCDVGGMMLEIYGKADGLCKGKGGTMHIADFSKGMLGANAIVGANAPLILGAALTAKQRGKGNVAVSFLGDGASNQGTVFEALNMAVVLQLPAIFVFENNGFGEGTAAEYAVGSGDIAGRAAAFGLPAVKVDGFDFTAVYEAAGEAVSRARKGEGPSVIETVCTRYSGHFVGDPQHYRQKEELETSRGKDPVKLFRERALAAGLLENEDFDAIDKTIAESVDVAVDEAISAEPPAASELHVDVYESY